ncbi:hypothetical protein [Emticicia sp.]|uniref:hypothetical protein n=1 Tax=Emticicia sp. TaxID=1930953 RepID=UPI003750975D
MKKILLLLVVSQLSFGQSKISNFMNERRNKKENRWANEHVYRTSALALTSQSFQQQVFSQNQFSGLGLAYFSSNLVDRPKIQKGFENYIGITPFLKAAQSTSTSYSVNAMFGYFYLKKMNESLAIGGQLNALIGGRLNGNYDNNSVSAEAIIELAPKLHYARTFRFLKKNLELNYTLSASVLGFGFWTPTYTANFTQNGIGLLSPKNYNHFNSRIMLKLPDGKRFINFSPTIGYGWNAYVLQANSEQKIINATHSIYLIAHIQKLK